MSRPVVVVTRRLPAEVEAELRKDFDVSGFSPGVRTILQALKTYGMLVADNGNEWAVSVAPDPRIPVLHEELRKVRGSDFEVVVAPRDAARPRQ